MKTEVLNLDLKRKVAPENDAGIGPWKMIWLRFKANKLAIAGTIVFALILLLVIVGPAFTPYERDAMDYSSVNLPPSFEHLCGTDSLGRDVFTRILYGGRISLSVGVVSTSITIILAVIIGGASGYFGGRIDNILQRIGEIVSSIPFLPLMMTLSAVMMGKIPEEKKMYFIMALIGFLSWPGLSRIIRAEILTLKEREFVVAAKAMGYSVSRQIFIHLIPNTVGYIVVNAAFGMVGAMLTEAGLSYLGLGVTPPVPTWGNLINAATDPYNLQYRFWLWVIPGIFLFLTVLSINLIGEGLRDAFDPKEQG